MRTSARQPFRPGSCGSPRSCSATRSDGTTLSAETAGSAEKAFSQQALRSRRFPSWAVAAGLGMASALFAQPPAQPLGRMSFPTSGSAQAQPQFVRGVLLLHSFEYNDAIDSFPQAQRLD